jgi:hypothetical protein
MTQWIEKLFGKKPVPVPTPELLYQPPVWLKAKKWVTHQGAVGIITDTSDFGFAWVDFVDSSGLTTLSLKVPVQEISLARYDNIPPSRMGISRDAARGLGYM